ncbi:MAG: hypothetical protein ACLU33_03175 [Christensenellales bacterium]
MEKNTKAKIKVYLPYVLIFIATLAICVPLLSKNLNMYRDDRNTTYLQINGHISIYL